MKTPAKQAKSAAKIPDDDPAMVKLRAIWAQKQAEGWTQERLGIAMGYPELSARKSISQFLKTRDPQISMLRRFAAAVGVALSTIVRE